MMAVKDRNRPALMIMPDKKSYYSIIICLDITEIEISNVQDS